MPDDRGNPGCVAGCLSMVLLALYIIALAAVVGGTIALIGWFS
jgi:hypothetical protein